MPSDRLLENPLTREEREEVQDIIRRSELPNAKELSTRLGAEWELDPTTRLLATSMERLEKTVASMGNGLRAEMSSLKNSLVSGLVFVAVIAILVPTVLFGYQVSVGGGGVNFAPAATDMKAIETDADIDEPDQTHGGDDVTAVFDTFDASFKD